MTGNNGNDPHVGLSEAQVEMRVTAYTRAVLHLEAAQRLIPETADRRHRARLHTAMAAVWADLAYIDAFQEGVGTLDPPKPSTQAHNASAEDDRAQRVQPEPPDSWDAPLDSLRSALRVGDTVADCMGDLWFVVDTREGEPILVLGHEADDLYRRTRTGQTVTLSDLDTDFGPLTHRQSRTPEPRTGVRTYTHGGVEYPVDRVYTDRDGDRWVIEGELTDGQPLLVVFRDAGQQNGIYNLCGTLAAVVARWGPLSKTAVHTPKM